MRWIGCQNSSLKTGTLTHCRWLHYPLWFQPLGMEAIDTKRHETWPPEWAFKGSSVKATLLRGSIEKMQLDSSILCSEVYIFLPVHIFLFQQEKYGNKKYEIKNYDSTNKMWVWNTTIPYHNLLLTDQKKLLIIRWKWLCGPRACMGVQYSTLAAVAPVWIKH